ncbi:MAG: SIS domain-containing protein, partial [Gammaproteobacteria bacterium]|nr:SIS domain-containing protein [Gammaproteobacteria bacterium]
MQMHDRQSGTVAERIRRTLDLLTPTERKPAQMLLAQYPFAGLETVAQFAKRSGVSGPTVLRLIGKLGFAGYADFQRVLRDELQAQIQSPLTKKHSTAPKGAAGHDFLDRFAKSVIGNIRNSVNSVPRAEFQAVVELLADRRRPVYLLGGRFTDPLAVYLCRHLRALRPGIEHIEGQYTAWLDYLLDMGKRDVLVVFDVRRYQQDLVRFAEQAAGRGVTVVLFTDQWLSPVGRFAKHVFPLRVEVPSSWDSAAATVALVEVLIAGVNEACWGKVK